MGDHQGDALWEMEAMMELALRFLVAAATISLVVSALLWVGAL